MFQIAVIGNVVINIYGVEMLSFNNSVLKMYLLNTQLSYHINSCYYFILFICFIKQFVEVYDKEINTWHFPYHLGYHPSTASRADMGVSGWYPGWYGNLYITWPFPYRLWYHPETHISRRLSPWANMGVSGWYQGRYWKGHVIYITLW